MNLVIRNLFWRLRFCRRNYLGLSGLRYGRNRSLEFWVHCYVITIYVKGFECRLPRYTRCCLGISTERDILFSVGVRWCP